MVNPTYSPNVPGRPSDTLATSQPQLLQNFIDLFNSFAENHVNLDAGATAGNHTVIQLMEMINDPQTDVTELAVYVKNDETSTDQIFIRDQGNGNIYQLTAYQIYGLTQDDNFNSYFTVLPGRILLYFGRFNFGALKNNTLNLFPPIATNIITVAATQGLNNPPFSPGGKPRVKIVEPSGDTKYITQIEFANSSILVNNVGTGPIIGQNYLVMANF